MWYILIHFDGSAVSGYICPGDTTKEEAIKNTKYKIIGAINMLKFKIKESKSDSSIDIYTREISRQKSFLQSFQKPWRITKRGDKVLRIQRIDFPLDAGFWLSEIITQQHTCNILPYSDEESVTDLSK